MSLFYRVTYWLGVRPWEQMARLPIGGQISSLLAREEGERTPPYGSVLDLGCGSGIWSVELGRRGWEVTGVDLVPKALRVAQRRVSDSGVRARLVLGDVTALRSAGIGSGFGLVVDFGTLHGLAEAQRKAAGREVSAVTAAGATMLMLAWVPGSRGPLPRGMTREDVGSSFKEWTIIDEQPADVSGAPGFVRKAGPRFFRLRREGIAS
jgi:SAM-dependent methyltransferase